MPLYRVTWVIDLEADSKQEAAEVALDIQHDLGSSATVFDVAEIEEETGGLLLSDRIDLGYRR